MTQVIMHRAPLARLLNDPTGPVARYVNARAQGAAAEARLHATGRPGPRIVTARLIESITVFEDPNADGVRFTVGAPVESLPRRSGRGGGFAYSVPLETGHDADGRVRNYEYPFLKPGLEREFGVT